MKPELNNKDFYCYIINVELPREEKNSEFNPFFLVAKCEIGKIKFAFWMPEKIGFKKEDKSTWPARSGDFIKVSFVNFEKAKSDYESNRPFSLQGKYNSHLKFIIVNEEDVPQEIHKQIYVDRTKQIKRAEKSLLEFIRNESNWKNKDLAKVLKDSIEEHQLFTRAPAAVGHHHAYEGGLLVHSHEVNFLCNSIADACETLYPGSIDRDVINISSWLHDIGKTETYYLDKDKDPRIYGEKESKINHILRGYSIFEKLAKKYNLDSDFIERVSHCILSHQDRIDWKTPVEPIDLEAIILAKSDKISSELAKKSD